MENTAVFEMRFAAHETQVAQINREGWKVTRDGKVATASGGRRETQALGKLAGLLALLTRRGQASQPTTAQVG